MIANPTKVLCFHGCGQTKHKLAGILKEYTRIGEQYNLEFYWLEAKYHQPGGELTWYNKILVLDDIGSIAYSPELVSDVLEDIDLYINTHQIDVLWGFSQGGNVVDTFLRHKGNKRIRTAVIFSGYALVEDQPIVSDLSILNVISKEDEVVPHLLAPNAYKSTKTIYHNKGHRIPNARDVIREICLFSRQ